MKRIPSIRKERLALLSLLFVAMLDASAGEFIRVKNSAIEGAIISAESVQDWGQRIRRGRDPSRGVQNLLGIEAQSFWTPRATDIATLEERLRAAFGKAVKEPATLGPVETSAPARKNVSEQIGRILAHYPEYRRQYIGVVVHRKRHILVNSFPAQGEFSYTREFVTVCDGGFWFWRILYSIDDGVFLGLSINGEA